MVKKIEYFTAIKKIGVNCIKMEWLKHLVVDKHDSTGSGMVINNRKEGKYYAKYPNGKMRFEENYVARLQHGQQLYWDSNGKLEYEWNYEHGWLHGVQLGWFENGRLAYEVKYFKGKLHGKQRHFHANGALSSEENYINGVKQK
jgi:antitoxin component YwqK of YwqJK toxin-antitoxin module